MTPAESKNKVYFMWDFVARTLVCGDLPLGPREHYTHDEQAMLPNVPPNLSGMNPMQKEVWSDVQSRASMAKNLILDTNAGMLDMMVCLAYAYVRREETDDCTGIEHLQTEWRGASF